MTPASSLGTSDREGSANHTIAKSRTKLFPCLTDLTSLLRASVALRLLQHPEGAHDRLLDTVCACQRARGSQAVMAAASGAAADALSADGSPAGRRSSRLSARVEAQVQTAKTGGACWLLRRRRCQARRAAAAAARALMAPRICSVSPATLVRSGAAAFSAQAGAAAAGWARDGGSSAQEKASAAAADGAGGVFSRQAWRRRGTAEAGRTVTAGAARAAAGAASGATACFCLFLRHFPHVHVRPEHYLAARRAL
jgi:hypothetical protein